MKTLLLCFGLISQICVIAQIGLDHLPSEIIMHLAMVGNDRKVFGQLRKSCKKYNRILQSYPVSEFVRLYETSITDKRYKSIPLIWAITKSHKAVIKKLLLCKKITDDISDEWDHEHRSVVGVAMDEKKYDIVELCMAQKHISYDTFDLQYVLVKAASKGLVSLMRVLLDNHNVQINMALVMSIHNTPLDAAIEHEQTEIVKILLEHPDIDVNLGYCPPLYRAVRFSTEEIVKLLLNHKNIDLNKKEWRDGWTPLHFLVEGWKNINLIQLFCERGARIDIYDKEGFTVLDLAKRNGDDEIVAILEKFKS